MREKRWCQHKNSALHTTSYRRTYKSQICFWFTSDNFLKRPILLKNWFYVLFLQGSHMQKQYQERTTFCAWGVLQSALQVSQPEYSALTWRHEHEPQGTRCKGFCSKEGAHYSIEQSARNPLGRDQVQRALGNCPEAVIGQTTINLISQVWKSLGDSLPKLYWFTLQRLMSGRKVRAQGLCVEIKGRCDMQSPNGHLHPKPLAKGISGKEYR